MITGFTLSANFLTLLGILIPNITAIILLLLKNNRMTNEISSKLDAAARIIDRHDARLTDHERRIVVLEVVPRIRRR